MLRGYPRRMSDRDVLRTLHELAGTTYAEQAGIRLHDKPAPLYRLLVLSVLLATRIRADLAVDAARALVDDGMGTPERMAAASWQDRVDALSRAHYRRYDESTATALGEGAELVRSEYGGDLRRLRKNAGGDPKAVRELLTTFPRLGPVGADIFCREAQLVWPELRPGAGPQGPRRRPPSRVAHDGRGPRGAGPRRRAGRHRGRARPRRARRGPCRARAEGELSQPGTVARPLITVSAR